MTPIPTDAVMVVDGLKADFFRRHHKDRKRAEDAWNGLVARRNALLGDAGHGEPITRTRWPPKFADLMNLYLIPELPHRFRALYTVFAHPEEGTVVRIEWIGDHREYDRLFGYRTS